MSAKKSIKVVNTCKSGAYVDYCIEVTLEELDELMDRVREMDSTSEWVWVLNLHPDKYTWLRVHREHETDLKSCLTVK